MAMIDWYIQGREFSNCNCSYGCPCQFEELPTYGNCRGFEAIHVDKGHFGETDLAGLNFTALYAFPGPVFEGGGEMQIIIDERANLKQREALEAVLRGEETIEAATHWWVYATMSDTFHPTLYKAIDLAIDIDKRSARLQLPNVIDASGRPIKPPHGDGEHRVQIRIPQGIEFEQADIGSASSCTGAESAVQLKLDDTYGQFNLLHHSGSGVVHA